MYELKDIYYKKVKDGVEGPLQDWNSEKIAKAIYLASERAESLITDEETMEVVALVESAVCQRGNNVVTSTEVHALVEEALEEIRPDVATSYRNYRSVAKLWAKKLNSIFKRVSELLFRGDKSNGNHDSKLASTIGALSAGYLATELYETQFLTAKEKQAAEDGYIYPHDKDKRYYYPLNCCQSDIANMLKGGFEMGNIWYNEPKALDTAFDVISDVVLSAASQQYGGFTVPEVDSLLEPYAEKSYQKYYKKYFKEYQSIQRKTVKRLGMDWSALSEEQLKAIWEDADADAKEQAEADVQYEFRQGFQGWEYKFNTVASSRGDYPFITVSGGLNTSRFGKMAMIQMLRVRAEGQGKEGHKKPVLFPKLVFLYDENIHGEGKVSEDVFWEGIECSSKTMYPDWLSLSGEGYVAKMYKKYGRAISPMGCRAFLSPWYEKGGMKPADENDKPVFMGRFNIGAVSLNLPMIYQKATMSGKNFYEVLDYYLEMIRNIHKRTYDFIGNMPASRAPLHFTQGLLYGGNLQPEDKIAPCLKSATASFGVTALNELQMLYNGKGLDEDNAFSLEVMEYINKKVEEFKYEDNHLYAIYGTPAESLCGKQVTQFRNMYGIINGVSDREYVTNSFHCHVAVDLNPFEKQDKEKAFWDLFNGGKIQYVKYPVSYNKNAYATLVRLAMELGFYEGCNRTLSYCEEQDCGYVAIDASKPIECCPKCGSKNITKIDRMNGYLSYTRVKGETRLNDAKMAEIAERKSM